MKRILLALMALTLLLGFTIFIPKTFAMQDGGIKATQNTATTDAATKVLYNKLYQEGIDYGAIKPKITSKDQWVKENEEQFMPVYKEGLDQHVFDASLSYSEWLKLNNYGQAPTVEDNSAFSVVAPNATVGGFTLKAGDIFITNATSSAGILGHAAIANGDNHILDMPGFFKTNRQSVTADWINEYSKPGYWIQVYRLKNSTLANKIAVYADTHYYSTTGTATQDVFLDYALTPHLYEINPTYCSKLVYDALWYGSGSTPLMQAYTGYVLPYSLISTFNSSYTPPLVKTYNN